MMKILLSLPGTLETLLRDAEIYRALKEAHHVTVAREVRQESCLRLGDFAIEKLTPVQALEKYLEAKKVPVELQKLLLEYGEKLTWEPEQG
jgi:hypothetical protein